MRPRPYYRVVAAMTLRSFTSDGHLRQQNRERSLVCSSRPGEVEL